MLGLYGPLFHQTLGAVRLERVVYEELSSELILQVGNRQRPRVQRLAVFWSSSERRAAFGRRQVVVCTWWRCARRERQRRVVEHGLEPFGLMLDVAREHEARDLLMHLVRKPPDHRDAVSCTRFLERWEGPYGVCSCVQRLQNGGGKGRQLAASALAPNTRIQSSNSLCYELVALQHTVSMVSSPLNSF